MSAVILPPPAPPLCQQAPVAFPLRVSLMLLSPARPNPGFYLVLSNDKSLPHSTASTAVISLKPTSWP
ncbi:Protein-tyrosine sulfotransferase 1 [Dissostichus eleginoides]|uniref:Protein-tyrosine sulfotransferase 1 n=1 Tax=Dissostichus eleginoides TaxID=100907 RepID=A0AAD9ESA0_DISEL|nr:Protein-tyrosine sulfotransferase 1 [Dissostichus eleginoides]